jgi:hypothetical protein
MQKEENSGKRLALTPEKVKKEKQPKFHLRNSLADKSAHNSNPVFGH